MVASCNGDGAEGKCHNGRTVVNPDWPLPVRMDIMSEPPVRQPWSAPAGCNDADITGNPVGYGSVGRDQGGITVTAEWSR